MNITIGIVARNEENFLSFVLDDLLKQTYDLQHVELILIDGKSTDSTMNLMQEFKTKHLASFLDIKIQTNEKQIQAAGWNLVFHLFTTEAVFRIDAHARLDCHFIENSVSKLMAGYQVVGGIRETISARQNASSKVLLNAENSLFGCSISDARHNTKPKLVNSVFHAGYLREVVEKVGDFNEKLGRTEDNEYHYRVRKAGYSIFMFNDIISYQYIRLTLRKDMKQKFLNGLWIGRTALICPKCLSIFHFVPFCFLMALIASCILILVSPYFVIGLMGLYLLFCIINTIITAVKGQKTILNIFLPFIFFLLHISYGVGTLLGFFTWYKGK